MVAKTKSYQLRASSSLPHERIKYPLRIKIQPAVESHGAYICLSHRQRECREISLRQVRDRGSQQGLADAARAKLRQNADLGHVANIVADARAENHPY